MIYPNNFENKIGFDKVRELIKNNCKGFTGKNLVDAMSFSDDIDFIKEQLSKTGEMLEICMLKKDFPQISYPDTEGALKKLKISDSCLSSEEILDMRKTLETTKSVMHFFTKQQEGSFPLLKKMISEILFPDFVYDRINMVFSANGNIKDSASHKLKEIRNNLYQNKKRVNVKTESVLQKIRSSGWIDKDLSATIVNGRIVLPIETTHKRKIKGLIHDESASGKTTYIEPQEIVELNNRIRELELEEKREIQKILFELTEDIRPYLEVIESIGKFVGEMDFLFAKSVFSVKIGGIIPAIDEKPGLFLVRAKHPLLLLKFKAENKEVVPTSLRIDDESRILVISGPNAGGKSVALKTAGLITYMTQCGLPVPVGGTSVIGIFNRMFVDMGDDQSIENDLSTYSSHLMNMKFFLKNADYKSLILIDEFGSGTDPLIGGNIAESILEELNRSKVFGLITTHYSNLKILASNTPGIENAAMLIDNNKMQALYVLEQGYPGSSYAIEIAERTGLPKEIIENAKTKTGNNNTDLDKFMRRILRDKKYWERKRQNIRIAEKKTEDVLKKHVEELEKLISERKKIKQAAQQESEEILKTVNRKIENTIRIIKESNADKEKTSAAREDLEKFKKDIRDQNKYKDDKLTGDFSRIKSKYQKLASSDQCKKDKINSTETDAIKIGDKVRIFDQAEIGEVMEINKKTAVIAFQNLITSISIDKIEKISNPEAQNIHRNRKSYEKTFYSRQVSDFKPYIDIRGERVEDALQIITEFIDNGTMLNFKELKILHGKGDGILRQNIRQYLKTFPQVKEMHNEDIRYGGDGITIVILE